jgi:hypothetical protein
MRRVAVAVLAVLATGAALAQEPEGAALVVGRAVSAQELETHPVLASLRNSFPACRSIEAQTARVKIDRGPDSGDSLDEVTVLTADCRRGRTQFLHMRLDRGAEGDEILMQMLGRADHEGFAVDPATRRLFVRIAGRNRLEDLRWQPLVREHLLRRRLPLREYVGVLLPIVPGGPVPPLTALARPADAPAATPAPVPAAEERARLAAELRQEIEAELRPRLAAELRAELHDEVQARLDRAREIVVGLERDLAAERAQRVRIETTLVEREQAIERERAAREVAERLLGLAQRAEADRTARERAEAALAAAREAERNASARAEADRAARESAERALEAERSQREAVEARLRTQPPAADGQPAGEAQ